MVGGWASGPVVGGWASGRGPVVGDGPVWAVGGWPRDGCSCSCVVKSAEQASYSSLSSLQRSVCVACCVALLQENSERSGKVRV